ncbi:ATP-dependent endonuclease [Peribacillus butanolivorans]|uniref:ATP-dependent nuclease n=1 Tax=Peribacillus butanolivorans TaxID=421767 RepID=UPI0035E26022
MVTKLMSLYVKNFRSIKTSSIENIDDINIFVGKNNNGKSNYLRAIHCFFKTLSSDKLYSEGVFLEEDIRGNAANDLLMAGLIQRDENYYLTFISCYKTSEEKIYSYHLAIEINESSSIHINQLVLQYIKEFERYSSLVVEFINTIRRIKRLNERNDNYSKEIEAVSSKIVDIGKVNAINVHSYIEENYELSNEISRIVKRSKIDHNNLTSEIVTILQGRINALNRQFDTSMSRINKIEDSIKVMWEQNYGFQRLTIILQNENITLPKILRNSYGVLFQYEKRIEITQDDAQILFTLKNKKDNIQNWINFKKMCKKVLDIEIDVFLDQNNVPVIDVSNNWINLNGTGIREVFRMILDIESQSPSIIFIEEPEIYLHFELQQKLSEYLHLKKEVAQLFITSHSTAFVEDANEKSVYLIRKNQDIESDIQLLDSESLNDVVTELGYNVQVLLIKKMLVFVEGKTDKVIIETYLRNFHPDIASKIGCIDMKGETKYKYFANAESLKIFHNSGMKTFFILDSDYKTTEDKQKKINNHPEGSELVFWSGVCIETLFLNPTILRNFINAKDEKRSISLDEITTLMEKTYDDIKLEALRKYIREKFLMPIYPENTQGNELKSIADLVTWFGEKRGKMLEKLDMPINLTKVIQKFEDNYGEQKGIFVPGDKFLVKFFNNLGNLTYKKNEKNARYLVEGLPKEDWPKNFIDVIDIVIRKFEDVIEDPS